MNGNPEMELFPPRNVPDYSHWEAGGLSGDKARRNEVTVLSFMGQNSQTHEQEGS